MLIIIIIIIIISWGLFYLPSVMNRSTRMGLIQFPLLSCFMMKIFIKTPQG